LTSHQALCGSVTYYISSSGIHFFHVDRTGFPTELSLTVEKGTFFTQLPWTVIYDLDWWTWLRYSQAEPPRETSTSNIVLSKVTAWTYRHTQPTDYITRPQNGW